MVICMFERFKITIVSGENLMEYEFIHKIEGFFRLHALKYSIFRAF